MTAVTTEYTHRSVSQLSTWVRCGEAYRLEKVVKAPRQPAAWFAQGIAFHTVAEAWEASLRTIAEDDLTILFYDEYDGLIADNMLREPNLGRWLTGGRVKASDDIVRRRERGEAMISTYLRYAETAEERMWPYMGEEVAVEVPFELDLEGLIVKGYIDQVPVWPDGRITVRDLKTGSKRPEWNFQLGVYALAIEQDYGIRPEWGDFYMLKDGKPGPRVSLAPFTRERVTRWFKDMDRAARLGIYLPNPGDACRTCGVPDFCQALGSRADEYAPDAYTEGEQ